VEAGVINIRYRYESDQLKICHEAGNSRLLSAGKRVMPMGALNDGSEAATTILYGTP
jgi:hypothetical protein